LLGLVVLSWTTLPLISLGVRELAASMLLSSEEMFLVLMSKGSLIMRFFENNIYGDHRNKEDYNSAKNEVYRNI